MYRDDQFRVVALTIVPELSQKWHAMSEATKIDLTDPLLEEHAALREEADTKPKVIPTHILGDVSSTMAKITHEVRL